MREIKFRAARVDGKLVLIEWNEAECMFWGGSNSQRYFELCKWAGNIDESPELLKGE